jgi:hypothetical protein
MDALVGVGAPSGLGGPGDGWDALPVLAALCFLVLSKRAGRRPLSTSVLLGALATALATPVLEAWAGWRAVVAIGLAGWVVAGLIRRRPRGDDLARV